MRALVPVDTRLFGLSRVVLLVRTAGCYRFPFTVPAVSQTSGSPIANSGDSPLGHLFLDVVNSHSVLAVSLDVRQSIRWGGDFPGRLVGVLPILSSLYGAPRAPVLLPNLGCLASYTGDIP